MLGPTSEGDSNASSFRGESPPSNQCSMGSHVSICIGIALSKDVHH